MVSIREKRPGPAARPKRKPRVPGCSVGDVFGVLGKTHTLNIMHAMLHTDAPQRFVDLQKALAISPNTLSQRLRELVAVGLLSRTAYNEIPPRVDYALTPKARDLNGVFHSFDQWAARHDLEPAPEGSEH